MSRPELKFQAGGRNHELFKQLNNEWCDDHPGNPFRKKCGLWLEDHQSFQTDALR